MAKAIRSCTGQVIIIQKLIEKMKKKFIITIIIFE